jgi:hypothetical protein
LRRFGALPLITLALVLSVAASAAAQRSSGAPVNISAPLVKGKTSDGKRLKASHGRWSGSPSYSYVWERCDGEGEGCAPIAGAAGATFQTSDTDVGHRLRAVVTATNAEGTGSATTPPSAKIAATAPKKKKGPAITGSAQDGQLLSAAPGTWLGTGPVSFAYQWESCKGAACTPIAGATHQSYRATTAELGRKLRVLLTATNVAGSGKATSRPSPAVMQGAPVDVDPPSVSGLPIVEQTLTADPGTWGGTGPITYTYQWRGCPLLGGECEDISGANEPTYTVGPLQITNSIDVVVTAHSALGSSSATSPPTDVIKALLPSNVELPSITGLLQDGGLLAALTGAWSGSEPLSFSYLWETCDADGLNCQEVSGAVGSTLGLLASAVGSTVRVIVTATNSAGSTTATSEPTSLVKALLPSNTALPSITGLLQDGSSLTALLGSWSGTGPLNFSQVWELCDAAGQNCKAIEGAVGSTLALIGGEVGDTVRLAVTASNGAGSTTATSEPTSIVGSLLPSNTALPSITGLLQDGGLLSAVTGSWGGTEPLGFSYQWLLCNAAGAACKEVSGAAGTGATLSLLTGMIGSTARLVVTATNGAGSTTATSEPTSLVKALLPSNTGLPSIVGSLIDGGILTGAKGSWSGSEPTFSQVWELCDAAGQNCKAIEGAVGSTLALLTSEIGHTVRLAVTATNSAGSTSATSEPTSLIKALLPSNTGLPSIAGSLLDGSTLTGSKGSWTGSEPSFSQVWELCDAAGQNCKAIEGAVGSTLGLLTSEIGKTVRLAVTATNGAGSKTAYSEPTSLVKALLPSNAGLPSIAGSLIDGSALTGAKGSWTGSEPSFSYQWLLCNSAGASCKELSGATGTTLGLLTNMIGSTARLVVTATNSAGATTATSEPTSLIKALIPSNTTLPSIAGLAEDAQTLTGAKGTWSGSEPSFSYQWLLCNPAGASCKEVSGATGTTFGLLTTMIGSTARLVVTATNSAGSTSATSAPTSSILAILPANPAVPAIAGILQVGKILEAVAGGKWTGSAPVNITYQWQTCGLLGKESECANIKEAVAKTLKLELLQVGLTMRVIETATNARGSVSKASAITSTVLGLL